MPINELSDARRVGRDFKVRLGVRKLNQAGRPVAQRSDPMKGSYPSETDYFVIDEAPEDIRKLYGSEPRALRVMLYQEWDAKDSLGHELVFNLNNRAYGLSKGLRCIGTGRSFESPGYATVSDESWANKIGEAAGQVAEPLPSKSGVAKWRVPCLGRDCPKYLLLTDQPDPEDPSRTKQATAPGHDQDASCKAVGILRCFLLHPSTIPEDTENYCKPLGVMELATGSINSIIDLQSDLDLKLRAFTDGRTAGVPVTLVRRATVTMRPFRQNHWTCAITFDSREVQRWAAIPLNEVFLSEPQREALKRLAASPLGMTVDSVAGLLPEHLLPEDLRGATSPVLVPPDGGSPEPEPALPGAGGSQVGPSPLLVRAQLDELKTLAGGPEDGTRPHSQVNNPWKRETMDRLRATVKAMNAETGTNVHYLDELRVEHLEFLKARLVSLPEQA